MISAAPGRRRFEIITNGHVQPVTELWQPRVLRDYSFIADGERGALVGPDGAMVWLCAPRWDSPAVFAALVGGRGGYSVTPAGEWHVWGGYYEPGSLIWHSRWVGSGVAECREALAMPADPHCGVVLRRIEAVTGPARLRVVLDLRSANGRSPVRDVSRSGDCWTARSGPIRFRWSGAARARRDRDGRLILNLRLPAGATHDLVLEFSDQPLDGAPPDPATAWAATEQAWSEVAPACDDVIAVRDTRHAYAVLRGMTSASGAMVAAATTSIPERLDAGRNYDYRFAWIRDQCLAGIAVAEHGPHPLLDGAVRFITERLLSDGPDLMPAYTVAGERIADERQLRLSGYPGASVVRTGNRVSEQFQLDGLGECLQLLAAAARLDRIGRDDWRAAETAAEGIAKRWTQADAGLWELDPKHWAHSRLTCVAGLRAIAAVAGQLPGSHGRSQAARWSGLADQIMASLRDCVHPSGRWQRSPDDDRVDAALLQPVIRGLLTIDDPRALATVRAIEDELTDDGYVYRFRQDARPLDQAEGAFLLCGLWAAQAAHALGEDAQAARWFERARAACGPAGLYTEEYDVHQRQLRGNFPQAFVHAAVLETAVRLSPGR